MTMGHRHRTVRLRASSPLRKILQMRVYHTRDLARVDASPYPYGVCDAHSHCWYLSLLSVLHRWTGLTLKVT